ncbi:Tn3 family transposase [Streptomyces sp. NPDC059247]|uniref:Tn3 family transposase n=1 Tax=Streptomyces sp. NPDC059247 TaxID=3346790 RepID=UPI0036A7DDF9
MGGAVAPAAQVLGELVDVAFGHATASLPVGKLSASGRQNALAAASKEYGAVRRTIYAARYLSDPAYRRKISRQLNKGESPHALKRDPLYAHEGAVRARHLEQQAERAWCLTLVTNAVVAWTTEYYGLAVESMRRAGAYDWSGRRSVSASARGRTRSSSRSGRRPSCAISPHAALDASSVAFAFISLQR